MGWSAAAEARLRVGGNRLLGQGLPWGGLLPHPEGHPRFPPQSLCWQRQENAQLSCLLTPQNEPPASSAKEPTRVQGFTSPNGGIWELSFGAGLGHDPDGSEGIDKALLSSLIASRTWWGEGTIKDYSRRGGNDLFL